MSGQNTVSPDTPIVVKVTLGGDTRRIKMPLNDLGAAVFETKLKERLDIQDKTVLLERWSDSARAHVKLDQHNLAAYKQLFRAAKAKLKLRITAKIVKETPALLVDSEAPSVKIVMVPPSYSSIEVNRVAPTLPEAAAVAQSTVSISPAVLDDTVAKAVNSYCSSEVFTGQLRETVRDEVKKISESDPISTTNEPQTTPSTIKQTAQSGSTSPLEFAVYCNNCSGNIGGTYYHCSVCHRGDYDLCKLCIENGIHCSDETHWMSKRSLVGGQVTISDTDFIKKVAARICNGCATGLGEDELVKCKDCKDYDLCLTCLRNNEHGHDPLHEFVPGSLLLHLKSHEEKLCKPGRNRHHAAICDNCESSIYGVRHKCLECPDFDFCNNCVGKSATLHPGHRFVPLTGSRKPFTALYNYNPLSRVSHSGVYCDGPNCTSFVSGDCIIGARYKCAICPDTDFCGNCEASPNNSHNATHPLIKMKTPIRNMLVTTDDGGERKMGDLVDEIAPTSETEKESKTTNAATQVHTVVDVAPTEEFATPSPQAFEEKHNSEPESLEAQFISDTIADNTVFCAGDVFTQCWTLKNTGTSNWPTGITVKFVGGDYMFIKSEEDSLFATTTVSEIPPGAETSFYVTLSATWPPNKQYTSYWRLTTPSGRRFGDKLWCSINVNEGSTTAEDDDTRSSKSVIDADSVKNVLDDYESIQEDLGQSNVSHKSQMIFPKLPVESPVHSLEHLPPSDSSNSAAPIPISPVSSHHTLALADDESIEGDICAVSDDESFLTDEEYDVLDASDEESFEECERIA